MSGTAHNNLKMQNPALLESLLLANKPISTLFCLLKEQNLQFYHLEVLNKIANILESGYETNESERNTFTETILEYDGHLKMCHKVLKLLWNKDTIPSSATEFLALDTKKIDPLALDVETPTTAEPLPIDLDTPSPPSPVQVDSDASTSAPPNSQTDPLEKNDNDQRSDINRKTGGIPIVSIPKIWVIPIDNLSNKSSAENNSDIEEKSTTEKVNKSKLSSSKKQVDDHSSTQDNFAENNPNETCKPKTPTSRKTRSTTSTKEDAYFELSSSEDEADFEQDFQDFAQEIRSTAPKRSVSPPLQRIRSVRRKILTNVSPNDNVLIDSEKSPRQQKLNHKSNGEDTVSTIVPLNDYRNCKNIRSKNEHPRDMSLPISLIFGKVGNYQNSTERRRKLSDLRRFPAKLLTLATKLVNECAGDTTSEINIDFIKLFNSKYPECLVTVYDNLFDQNSIKYQTPKTQLNENKRIDIFYDKEMNHYFHIKNTSSLFDHKS